MPPGNTGECIEYSNSVALVVERPASGGPLTHAPAQLSAGAAKRYTPGKTTLAPPANGEAAAMLCSKTRACVRVMRLMTLGACAAGAVLAGVASAQAQPFPSRPVRIICTFAAGGTTDVLARGVARQLSEIWGQQVVVENRAGANTQIGAEHVAKSPGDGYTLMVTSEGTFVMNPSSTRSCPMTRRATSSRSRRWWSSSRC